MRTWSCWTHLDTLQRASRGLRVGMPASAVVNPGDSVLVHSKPQRPKMARLVMNVSSPPSARGPAIEVLDYHTAGEPFRLRVLSLKFFLKFFFKFLPKPMVYIKTN